MIELTSGTAPTSTVDLTRLRAVVPRYQRTQLAVRLWGERVLEDAAATRTSLGSGAVTSPHPVAE